MAIVIGIAFASSACGASIKNRKGSSVEGLASWYGGKYHGRKTASGERFDKTKRTAAHRTLAFGTVVRVTRLSTGKSIEVRINDRGPFGNRDRIIDLSEGAAEALSMKSAGITKVRIEVISVPRGKDTR